MSSFTPCTGILTLAIISDKNTKISIISNNQAEYYKSLGCVEWYDKGGKRFLVGVLDE